MSASRSTSCSAGWSPPLRPARGFDPEDLEEGGGEEVDRIEEETLETATSAETIAKLEAEIASLRALEEQALRLKLSGEDATWRELDAILDAPIMLDPATDFRRNILIFNEPEDTLEYLVSKIAGRTGDAGSVVAIHGELLAKRAVPPSPPSIPILQCA